MSHSQEPIEPPFPGKYRAGDVVRHLPTGETWCLAIDEEQGYVQPAGWPHYMARPKEVRMIKKATDEQRLSTLRSWASDKTSPEANSDVRCLIARRTLQEEEQRKNPVPKSPYEDFRWATMNDTTVNKGMHCGAPLEVIIGHLAREKYELVRMLIEAQALSPKVIHVRPSCKREDQGS